jgi:Mg2+ and Co2+ transporter CorA
MMISGDEIIRETTESYEFNTVASQQTQLDRAFDLLQDADQLMDTLSKRLQPVSDVSPRPEGADKTRGHIVDINSQLAHLNDDLRRIIDNLVI